MIFNRSTRNLLKYVNHAAHEWRPNDGKPIIAVNEGDDKRENPYIVLRTITYNHGLLHPIVIPRMFHTDLGSIPWLFKVIPGFRPTDPGKRAFLVHDWCYRKQVEDRRIIDAIMYSALVADGMSRVQAWICWAGVRCFGRLAWNQNKRRLNHEKQS